MPRTNLRLTKAIRQHIIKNFELLPHEVLEMERQSLSLRLQDAQHKEKELLSLIDTTNSRREFKHLLKTELPKLQHLISRIKNELEKLRYDFSYEHQLHLYQHDPTVYKHPKDISNKPVPGSQAG